MQGSNGEADIERTRVRGGEEGECETNTESNIKAYALPRVR